MPNITDFIPARTIYPPYAWAIFNGLKWWETTPRPVRIRGRIAIHAARACPVAEMWRFVREINKCRDVAEYMKRGLYTREWMQSLPHGEILGTVEIVDCIPVDQMRDRLTDLERAFVDISDGRYACKLANPIQFAKPIPATGQQGFWRFYGMADSKSAQTDNK